MWSIIKLLILLTLLFATPLLYAQPPVISRNVTVITNVNSNQCPVAWRGKSGQENITRYGAGADYNMSGPVIRSCTGCRPVINQSNSTDCVCRTCYDYFN